MQETTILVEQVKVVLLRSLTAWAGYLGTLFGFLAMLQPQLPFMQDFMPKYLFGILTLACALAVPLTRIIKQPALRAAVEAAQAVDATAPGA